MAKIYVENSQITVMVIEEKDYISITDMVKNINAVLINDGISQSDRLQKLNKIAIG